LVIKTKIKEIITKIMNSIKEKKRKRKIKIIKGIYKGKEEV
jgi:hypothetical protein